MKISSTLALALVLVLAISQPSSSFGLFSKLKYCKYPLKTFFLRKFNWEALGYIEYSVSSYAKDVLDP